MDDNRQSIRDALSEYQDAAGAYYERVRDDLLFAGGEQWPVDQSDRLNLVMDQTGKFCQSIVGPVRVHPFGFGVAAMDDKARQARVNALLAKIQQDCGAYYAYAEAFELAVLCGLGWLIVGTDWANGDGLEKKILITAPSDPTCTWIDPASMAGGKLDGSDAENAAHLTWIGAAQAKRLHGIEAMANWELIPNKMAAVKDSVPMVSYWSLRSDRQQVAYIAAPDGQVIGVPVEQLQALPGVPIIGTREVRQTRCDYEQWVGNEQIQKTVLDIPSVPVVPVLGRRIHTDEGGLSTERVGIVRLLRDTQTLINLGVRAEAERLDMAPKSPWIAATTQVLANPAIARMWDESNVENRSTLLYEPVPGVPEPHRADVNPHTAEIQATRKGNQSDMLEQMGMGHGDFGGRGSKEVSGYALSVMQETSDYQKAGWTQNIEASVVQVGRIVSKLLQAGDVYQSGLVVSVKGENGQSQQARVTTSELMGDEEITVTTSASMQARKRNGGQILATLAGQSPEFASAFADIILETSGADISDEAIQRARKLVPPHLTGDAPDPQAMQTMQQQADAIKQLQGTIEQYEALISQLQAKIIGDTDKAALQLQVAREKNATSIIIEQMKQDGKMDELQAKAITDILNDVYEQSAKSVEISQGPVSVSYTRPMDAFTPMAPGPLVVGNAGGAS